MLTISIQEVADADSSDKEDKGSSDEEEETLDGLFVDESDTDGLDKDVWEGDVSGEQRDTDIWRQHVQTVALVISNLHVQNLLIIALLAKFTKISSRFSTS